MAQDMRRLTISLPEDVNVRLDRIKQATYYNTSRSKMIQDIIRLGLDVMDEQNKKDEETQ